MVMPDVSRRGVYYNLNISPYCYTTPYGDIFKFSSAKKLEIYTRKVEEKIVRLQSIVDKYHACLGDKWAEISRNMIDRSVYEYVYNHMEGGV